MSCLITHDTQFRLFINEWRAPDRRYKFVKGARSNYKFWYRTRNLTSWDYGLLLDFWSACVVPLWARRQLRRRVWLDRPDLFSLSPDLVELVKNPETLNRLRVLTWMMIKDNNIHYASSLRWKGVTFDAYTLNEMKLMREEANNRINNETQQTGQEGEILQGS